MSLTAWSVFYVVEICCWSWMSLSFRKEDGDGRAAGLIVWFAAVAFSTIIFFVGLWNPEFRYFFVRLQ